MFQFTLLFHILHPQNEPGSQSTIRLGRLATSRCTCERHDAGLLGVPLCSFQETWQSFTCVIPETEAGAPHVSLPERRNTERG